MSKAAMRGMRRFLGFTLSALALIAPARGDDPPQQAATDKLPPPVQLTTQQDHKRLLELLNIKELRSGANAR